MKLAIFDLDGTLANDSQRTPFAVQKRWTEYFNNDRMLADLMHSDGRVFFDWFHDVLEWDTIYLTGRRYNREATTRAWLKEHDFPRLPLFMRQNNSHGEVLADFKVRIIKQFHELWDIEEFIIFDDDEAVIAAVQKIWGEKSGVLCTWQPKPEAMIKWGNA